MNAKKIIAAIAVLSSVIGAAADVSLGDVFRQRFAVAADIERNELLLKDFVSDVKAAFPSFLASDTAGSLAMQERNALVSNIVLAAHFTPDEAAALGLTNVVQQASN